MTSRVIASGRIVRAKFRASSPLVAWTSAITGAFQIGGQQIARRRIVVDDEHRGAVFASATKYAGRPPVRFAPAFQLAIRQSDCEGRTFTGLAGDRDIAAQQLAKTPGDRQSKAGAAVFFASWRHRPG